MGSEDNTETNCTETNTAQCLSTHCIVQVGALVYLGEYGQMGSQTEEYLLLLSVWEHLQINSLWR